MSTLHQYHWHNITGLHQGLPLMSPGDALVIYGLISDPDIDVLLHDPLLNAVQWYLVKSENAPNSQAHVIDHNGWVQLLTNHHNSCTWKS